MGSRVGRHDAEQWFMGLCSSLGLDYDPNNPYSEKASGDETVDCPRCEGVGHINGQTEWGSNRDLPCPAHCDDGKVTIPDGHRMPERFYLDYARHYGGWCICSSKKGGSVIGGGMTNERVPTGEFVRMLRYAIRMIEMSGLGVKEG